MNQKHQSLPFLPFPSPAPNLIACRFFTNTPEVLVNNLADSVNRNSETTTYSINTAAKMMAMFRSKYSSSSSLNRNFYRDFNFFNNQSEFTTTFGEIHHT